MPERLSSVRGAAIPVRCQDETTPLQAACQPPKDTRVLEWISAHGSSRFPGQSELAIGASGSWKRQLLPVSLDQYIGRDPDFSFDP